MGFFFFFGYDRCLKEEVGMAEVARGSWLVALLSSVWVVGYGSLKSNVSLMSLWVSQVHRGSLKSGGIGWVLNWCGSWQVVVGCVALKLKVLEKVKQ